MKRGEIWTVSGGPGYTSKPRPVVVIQDDRFDKTLSVTVCGLTTTSFDAPLSRPIVSPSDENGLLLPSQLMVDKITSVPRKRLGRMIGKLAHDDTVRLDRSLAVFLGLAGRP